MAKKVPVTQKDIDEYKQLTEHAVQLTINDVMQTIKQQSELEGKIYGYARTSTKKQKLDRQIKNIYTFNKDAIIFSEKYSGTTENRDEWQKLKHKVKAGDTIIFDSVSRMSRNEAEGFESYMELYNKNVKLIFLKERHIDTQAYKDALEGAFKVEFNSNKTSEDELIKDILSALNRFMMRKVEADIRKAFEQSEKEASDIRQRTREGIRVAKEHGKTVGRIKDKKYETAKSKLAKADILRLSRDFNGDMTDIEVRRYMTTKISRNSYYKYKNELISREESPWK